MTANDSTGKVETHISVQPDLAFRVYLLERYKEDTLTYVLDGEYGNYHLSREIRPEPKNIAERIFGTGIHRTWIADIQVTKSKDEVVEYLITCDFDEIEYIRQCWSDFIAALDTKYEAFPKGGYDKVTKDQLSLVIKASAPGRKEHDE